jgi:Rps23 Pro-64 3,4-dihydroxylase Tpa1-like proline 4-hydroxylase
MIVQPFDRDDLRRQFLNATPFPFVKIDDFLESDFAKAVAAAYPSFEEGMSKGRSFKAVNEKKKIQITDSARFPKAIAELNDALAAPGFLSDLSYMTGIPKLLADSELVGGGMHITGPGGRLDVHVDFNYMQERKLHRRLNLLIYLNPVWQEAWGGHIQLWDKDVKKCEQSFVPKFNRCVIFETSEISYHGVNPVLPIAEYPRISFATYYYTREAPANWDGRVHSTIFKARPEERMRRYVLMPAEQMQRRLASGIRRVKSGVKQLVKSDG